jgi:hypothetical protein
VNPVATTAGAVASPAGEAASRLIPPSRELSRSTTPAPEEVDPRRRR